MEKVNICRTAIGVSVQAAKLLGKPYEYLKYTTLNEFFDINAEAHLDENTSPSVKYWAIGRGGHRMHIDDENTAIPDIVSHETTNTGPFKSVPFVLRQLNDDLSAEDRAKYALRRKEVHNGIEYYAYYLKRFTPNNAFPEIIHDNTKDGVTISKPFTYTNDDLHPTPSDLPSEGVVVSSADIIRISAKLEIDFNEFDVTEYYKVCKILYGTEQSSVISEFLICSGLDKEVNVDSGGSSVVMNEAIGVQVITFISSFVWVTDANRGFHYEFELGEGEPLLTKGETRNTRYSPNVSPSAIAATLAGTAYDASHRGSGTSTTASISASKPTHPGANNQIRPVG